jgi:hypothetical protein
VPPVRKDLTAPALAAWLQNIAAAALAKCEELAQKADKTGEAGPPLAIASACADFRDSINKAAQSLG